MAGQLKNATSRLNLEAACALLKLEDKDEPDDKHKGISNPAITRIYYAMFQAIKSLAQRQSIDPSAYGGETWEHGEILRLIKERQLVHDLDEPWLRDLKNFRQRADYEGAQVHHDEAKALLVQAARIWAKLEKLGRQ